MRTGPLDAAQAFSRAVLRPVSTPLTIWNNSRSHECERGTHERVRHVVVAQLEGLFPDTLSVAQRVRRAPQKRPGSASRRAPFCATSTVE